MHPPARALQRLDACLSRWPGVLSLLSVQLDPDVLQGPGGLGVALLLGLRTAVLSTRHSRRLGHV